MTRSTAGKNATAFRFPPELMDRLKQAAEERDLPMNWLVVRAVSEFLDRLLPLDEMVLTRDRNGDGM